MTVSGTTSFTQTQYQVIQTAFGILNVYGIGRTFSNEDYSLAVNMLNLMIKAWGAKGLHLWCKEEAVLYLQQYQAQYGFGNSNSIGLAPAYATVASGSHITLTTAAIPVSTTLIPVLSSSGLVIGMNLGLVQSDGTLFWTTIATIPDSTSITITVGPSVDVVLNANVYAFTTLLNKPYRIISARIRSGFDYGSSSTINETIMNPLSHADYYDLPTKTNNGLANQFYYDPQTDYGVIDLWSRPADCSYRVHFTYERIIDDITNVADTFDFPVEWLEAITWQLALRLAFPFAKLKQYAEIKEMASLMLVDLLDWDSEVTGVSFQPDRDGGGVY